MNHLSETKRRHEPLPDGATVAVVGGGPAGAFFALRILRRARELGRRLEVVILEKKREAHSGNSGPLPASWDGCNYCAGGISPRLAEVLKENGLSLPDEIVEGSAEAITVHGDWKSIELPITEAREMFSEFRCSRPEQRPSRYANFDSYLLNQAIDAGAKVISANVREVRYASNGRPQVVYQAASIEGIKSETFEADFVVLAGGVNQLPGMKVEEDSLFRSFRRMVPGFRPPEVRKTLICEMLAGEKLLQHMKGEVHFVQYGSKDLPVEMSSIIPKGRWITVVLLGKSVDRADPPDYLRVVEGFLKLPQIRRLLPPKVELAPACLCHPNMTVGIGRYPFGHRIALVGDMAVARLYKDGIFSAYATASALADCLLEAGIDRTSLRSGYWPVVRGFHRDNRFGRAVFLLNRLIFAHPVLSRIVYQALLTERRAKPRQRRRLANVLWRIASGDDTYRRILGSMFHPETAWLILVGGVLVTARNHLTERLCGLSWTGFGRFATGVPVEAVERKRREIIDLLDIRPFRRPPGFERTYSIRIKADEAKILHQLGKFGDVDRQYFTPRIVRVHRTAGNANEVGSTIRYDVFLRWLSFSVALKKVVAGRYLLYRVCDGFARGGVLAFDVDREKGGSLLTIYVAFDFPAGGNLLERLGWSIFRLAFPAFVHDVLWNHSLCRIKYLAEAEGL